mmetsp:Transcript_42432/g.76201  ORF Transcript_42432/g.76201 Transcript_42432/m.76201 type:complete len:87 (-) Transcript_42432:655-915(-)
MWIQCSSGAETLPVGCAERSGGLGVEAPPTVDMLEFLTGEDPRLGGRTGRAADPPWVRAPMRGVGELPAGVLLRARVDAPSARPPI